MSAYELDPRILAALAEVFVIASPPDRLPGDPGYRRRLQKAFTDGHITAGELLETERLHRLVRRRRKDATG